MKRNNLFAVAAVTLLASIAFGQEHGGAHEEGIPSIVMWQAINFALYAGLLFYLLRHPVKNYFAGRQEEFNQALKRAQAARNEAEQRKREIQERLSKLESSSAASVAEARAEAEALKNRIIQEAQAISNNMREEAKRTATFEIQRAKNELREELLNQSIQLSTKILKEKMAEPDQKRLQTEFADKIEVH
jgi:F-type H+-transporting ATPase subunit b